jgi:hypothetical protein
LVKEKAYQTRTGWPPDGDLYLSICPGYGKFLAG